MDLPGTEFLGEGGSVLVDSGPLIYLLERGDRGRARVVEAFVAAAERGELRLSASVAAWTELLAKPLGERDDEDADRVRTLLSGASALRLEPIEVSVAESAARVISLARRGSIGFADALHLATAFLIGADAVLTNDGAWRDFVDGLSENDLRSLAGEGRGKGRHKAAIRPRVLLVDELGFGLSEG